MDFSELDRLVILAQAGDHEALKQVMKRVLPKLQVAVAVRCHDPLLAEEVVQETLVTALRNLSSYRPEGTFIAWLKGISRNHLRDELRQRARQRATDGPSLEAVLAAHCEAQLDVDQDLVAKEEQAATRDALTACLESVPERMRLLILRRHVDGLPVNRLAQQFKRSSGSIAATLKRLRSSLRHCLQQKLELRE